MAEEMMNVEQNDRPVLIRVSEAARDLNVTTVTIGKLIAAGRLDTWEIACCTRKVDRRQVEQLINSGYKPRITRK
jgi:excisionase family DNA binding protein